MHVYLIYAFMYLYTEIFVLYAGMVESRHRQTQSSMQTSGALHINKWRLFAMKLRLKDMGPCIFNVWAFLLWNSYRVDRKGGTSGAPNQPEGSLRVLGVSRVSKLWHSGQKEVEHTNFITGRGERSLGHVTARRVRIVIVVLSWVLPCYSNC